MMFFKSTLALSALFAVASALAAVDRHAVPSHDTSVWSEVVPVEAHHKIASFHVAKSDCDKADEDDCTEFCSLTQQTATCAANGNKVTCYCKGGKSETNCEERCLLCMPGKSALEEATRLFKLGGSKMDEL